MSKRNYHIDNIKLLLLFLVALAHTLIPFREMHIGIDYVIKAIYFFHMPMFALVTGYLVSKSKRDIWGYVKKLLVPYVVFQALYVVLGKTMVLLGVMDYSANTMTISMVEPSSPLYFLVCLVFISRLSDCVCGAERMI